MRGEMATVTTTDAAGRRHSLDVLADSSFDAAHLYLTAAHENRASMLPVPTTETLFEVVSDGKVFRVTGTKLRLWILKRREDSRGPSGYLFRKRAILE